MIQTPTTGCAGDIQQFSLGWGTVPNLETLVVKHLQVKLYSATVKTAVEDTSCILIALYGSFYLDRSPLLIADC